MNSENKIDGDIKPWHALELSEVYSSLETRESGISNSEAESRLKKYGLNKLPAAQEKLWIWKFLHHYDNVLIYTLLGAGLITALLDHWIDTWIILAVVVINGLIGYIQEGKAEKALAAVRNMLSLTASVEREGERREKPSEKVVPGDLVHLKSGDKVPADIRIISVKELRVDEASLTGESEAVGKQAEPVDLKAALGDRKSMVYSGSLVVSGQATGIAVATGEKTEIGQINKMLSNVEQLKTPLLRQVEQFGKSLTLIILAIGGFTFLVGYYIRGIALSELFLSIVGLAVAAIPEGLPAVMTITMAIGVQKMAGRNAIIRKLPGVETLGSVSVICSDKTGTLTRGEMTVTRIALSSGEVEVGGSGSVPEGDFTLASGKIEVESSKVLQRLFQSSVLCNDGLLVKEKDVWKIEGSPTEGALLVMAGKGGYTASGLAEKWDRVDVIPFESEHKFMATLSRSDSEALLVLKGAPEKVLKRCSSQFAGNEEQLIDREFWDKTGEKLASEGHRLLAFACKTVGKDEARINPDSIESGLSLIALVGLLDPPRDESVAAVRKCLGAGIRVKMITGDHALTAKAIADQISFGSNDRVITGPELDETSDEDLVQIADEIDVFARVSPEHKLRLVTALQKKGYITAMTGDGVNDAPALKRADIGIAMGIKGTEASKEAAVMVLADDNFASIAHAVEEGRTVYDNLRKALLFMLPTNGGEALTIIAAIIFGLAMPITPAQILWINMVTAVTLALALAFEPTEKDVMHRPPRDSNDSLTPPTLVFRIGFVSILLAAATLGIYAWGRNAGLDLELSRTLAVNTLIFAEIFYLFNSRLITASSMTIEGLRATRWVWGAVAVVVLMQIIYTYVPFMHVLFGAAPLTANHWLMILAISFTVFLLVEAEKGIQRKLEKNG